MKNEELQSTSEKRPEIINKAVSVISFGGSMIFISIFPKEFANMARIIFEEGNVEINMLEDIYGYLTVPGLIIMVIGAVWARDIFFDPLYRIINLIRKRETKKSEIVIPSRYTLLKLSEIFYSTKVQKEVFLLIMADWDREIYEALEKNKDANLFMINARNTYAFLISMWQKSLIGDLIQFVSKIAKP